MGDDIIADEFVDKYHEMRRAFEFLGPDKIKPEYFEHYKWFSEAIPFICEWRSGMNQIMQIMARNILKRPSSIFIERLISRMLRKICP